jgi:hypothetical protein
MKKTIKLLLQCCCIAAIGFGCQKKDTRPSNSNNIEEIEKNEIDSPSEPIVAQRPTPWPQVNAVYTTGPGNRKYCWELLHVDCTILKEIIIKPSFDGLITSAAGGTEPVNSNSAKVAELFSNSIYQDVFDKIPNDHLVNLRSGNYYLAVTYKDTTKICILAGPQKPVTDNNFVFALQYDK